VSFSDFKKKKGKFDFHKGSYKSECFYLLMLIKSQNPKSWTSLNEEFRNTPDAKTWEFYQKLKDIYAEKKQATKKVAKKVTKKPVKKVAKKATKAPSKKKKVTKKAPKKVVKISAKKKVVKKPAAKKTAKKTVKKTTTRKKAA